MQNGFSFSDAVNSLVKKVKANVGEKASKFFTMKTSYEVAAEKYAEDQRKICEDAQAKNNLDSVVDDSLQIQRNQITRMLKCKSLFSNKFIETMMARQERDVTVMENTYKETGLLAGFMSKEGYALGIEVHADWYEQYTITFGYLHDRDGDMKQVLGPMTYDEIVEIGYPAWFNELIERARAFSIK
jgi:hypothetical protein